MISPSKEEDGFYATGALYNIFQPGWEKGWRPNGASALGPGALQPPRQPSPPRDLLLPVATATMLRSRSRITWSQAANTASAFWKLAKALVQPGSNTGRKK